MKSKLVRSALISIAILFVLKLQTLAIDPQKNFDLPATVLKSNTLSLHNDSAHQLNFRYADRKRGIKPYLAPALLIGTGTALHFSDLKYQFNDWIHSNILYSGHVDDYLRYAPLAAVYGLNIFGVKGNNNYGNVTAIAIKSFLLNDFITYSLKSQVNATRPNGDGHSFPSGHTSTVFAMAQIVHHEFGEKSIWYSVGAYSCAATVGIMRVAKGAHWASDVLAGAGIGMLSTELIYLTHQYKWDWEHVKQFDIFPFSFGQQKGLSLVYTF